VRLAGTSAALALLAAAALTACGGGGDAPTATTTSAPAAPPATTQPSALAATCARYATAHDTARQVVRSAASPVLAAAPAFVLIGLRQTAVDAINSVPPSAAMFTELRDAIDDLNRQATAALPPGADGTKTLVTVQPARLGAALDGVDTLCATGGR